MSESTPGDKPVETGCRACDFIGPRQQYEDLAFEVHRAWHEIHRMAMAELAERVVVPIAWWGDPTPRITSETRALVEEAYRAAAQ